MVEPEVVNRVTWMIPNALALIGSRAGEEWNGMTASWITQLSMEPVIIGVGVDNAAVTHRLITDGGAFTVNLWSPEDTRVFVRFPQQLRQPRPHHPRGHPHHPHRRGHLISQLLGHENQPRFGNVVSPQAVGGGAPPHRGDVAYHSAVLFHPTGPGGPHVEQYTPTKVVRREGG